MKPIYSIFSIPKVAVATITMSLLSGCTGWVSKHSFSGGMAPLPLPIVTPAPTIPLVSTPSPSPIPVFPAPNPEPSFSVIKTFKPVLAARGASCILCHANIHSNIITDFGYGDPIYMGGGRQLFTGYTSPESPWYRNYVNTWQTASIIGNVYVPKALAPAGISLDVRPISPWPPGGITLQTLLTTPYYNNPWSGAGYVTPPSNQAASYGIKPDDPANPDPVISLDQVIIRAPTDSDIYSIIGKPVSGVVISASDARNSGLTVKGSGLGSYVSNLNGSSSAINCYGDVVITGPLLLKNLVVNTDDFGCRLYVAGTVLIQGPIVFPNNPMAFRANQNLQISSSRAILMGMEISKIAFRMSPATSSSDNIWVRNGPWSSRYNEILNDYNAVAAENTLVDGGAVNMPYSHILLNAPVVESRYLGDFSGVIITEIIQFRLGQFRFDFDPTFSQIPILPALPNAPLVVQ